MGGEFSYAPNGAALETEPCVARHVDGELARLLDDVCISKLARGRYAAPREHLGVGGRVRHVHTLDAGRRVQWPP